MKIIRQLLRASLILVLAPTQITKGQRRRSIKQARKILNQEKLF